MEHKTPKHIVAVAGYLTNEKNEVLLTKVHWRADTWELPGGTGRRRRSARSSCL